MKFVIIISLISIVITVIHAIIIKIYKKVTYQEHVKPKLNTGGIKWLS